MVQKTRESIHRSDWGMVESSELWPAATTDAPVKIEIRNLNIFYGKECVLHDVTVAIPETAITAFVGPSGSGKTTFLRSINRLHDLVPMAQMTGNILIDGEDVTQYEQNGERMTHLRQQAGMHFQYPNPFSMSIFENVAYGVRQQGKVSHSELEEIVESTLRCVMLWDEVKDQLKHNALRLASGQQRRLCLARLLATSPEVLLLDEPYRTLDPWVAQTIEQLILQLGKQHTIIMTTTNANSARHVAQMTGHFIDGYLVQYLPTKQAFSSCED